MFPYKRTLVTLKGSSLNDGFGGRAPSGRCLLEERGHEGKISLWVQNLRPNVLYKAMVVSQHRFVPVGTVTVDQRGHGEFRTGVTPQDIGQSGLAMEEIQAVHVVVAGEGDARCTLEGYVGEYDWKGRPNLQRTVKEADAFAANVAPVEEPPEGQSPPEAIVPPGEIGEPWTSDGMQSQEEVPYVFPVVEPVLTEEEVQEETLEEGQAQTQEAAGNPINASGGAVHNAFKSVAQTFSQSLDELEHYAFTWTDDKETAEQGQGQGEEAAPVEVASDHTDEAQTMEVEASGYIHAAEIKDIFKSNLCHNPFRVQENSPMDWCLISLKELAVLPVDPQLLNAPMVILGYKLHNHLLLGQQKESPRLGYVVGVPAQYSQQQQPVAEQLGFNRFTCCDGAKASEGAYGYWMLNIN